MKGPIVVKSMRQLRASLARAHPKRLYRAYKFAHVDGRSPVMRKRRPILVTTVGAVLRVPNADTNEGKTCARGVNVATKQWIFDFESRSRFTGDGWYDPVYNLFIVEFRKRDIACVPTKSDGKFRLFRCKVIKKVKVQA